MKIINNLNGKTLFLLSAAFGCIFSFTIHSSSSAAIIGYLPDQPEGAYLIKENVYDEDGNYSFNYDYVYNDENQLISINCVSHSEVSEINNFEYDANGNLIKETFSPDGEFEYIYDANDVMIQASFINNGTAMNVMTFTYDSDGRLTENDIHVLASDDYNVTKYEYDQDGNLIAENYSDGTSTTYVYDDDDNLIEKIMPGETRSVWTYENGLKVSEKYYFEGEFLYSCTFEYEHTDSDIEENEEKNSIYENEITKKVQEALNNAGYDCGEVDGIAGSKTSDAITKYQEDNNLVVSGDINEDLLNSLGIASEEKDSEKNDAGEAETSYSPYMQFYLDYVAGNSDTWTYIGANADIPEPDSCLKNIGWKTVESNMYFYVLEDQDEETLNEMASAYSLILTLDCGFTLDSVSGIAESIQGIYSGDRLIGLLAKGIDPDMGYYIGLSTVI